MQFYKFNQPSQWNGCRDIEEEIDMDKITKELNYDMGDGEENEEEENQEQKAPEDGKKSKKSVGKEAKKSSEKEKANKSKS